MDMKKALLSPWGLPMDPGHNNRSRIAHGQFSRPFFWIGKTVADRSEGEILKRG